MTTETEPTQDIPSNADAPQASGNVDDSVSAGGKPTDEPQTTATGGSDEELQSKYSRLETENERNKQFISKTLNIPADSDIVDQVVRGVITPEQALEMTGVKTSAQPAPVDDQSPQQRIDNIMSKRQKGENVTEGDFYELAAAFKDSLQEIKANSATASQEQLLRECTEATSQVLANDPNFKDTPEEIKELETNVFMASTDYMVGNAINNLPVDQRRQYFTPQNYGYYAGKNLESGYGKLREHWINRGRELERGTATTTPTVNPISTNTGSAPMTPAKPKMSLDNFETNIKAYNQQGTGQL